MDVLFPRTLDEALEMKAERPEAIPIAGGTDLMVELNFGRLRPPAMMEVSRLPELAEFRKENGSVFLGAGVTYMTIERELTELVPLVQASRTVGSPQIRNRATVGGNLGTASPAGDALPVLAAYDAEILMASARRGTRSLPWNEFLTAPKKNALEPGELLLGARWKVPRGPGSFSKIGTRNAMVISVAGVCLQIDEEGRGARVALGSVAPTIVRAREAEEFLAGELDDAGAWSDPSAPVPRAVVQEFGERVAAATSPIDDVRGTAAYRRHAVMVLARRALSWALVDRAAGTLAGG
jgi:CO/xanthine dehydrogenase FAD-binding subunit